MDPPSIPIPGVSKLIRNNFVFMISLIFMEESETSPARGLKKGSSRKLQQPFSRGGSKRGDPTMTTSTITASWKGDPQHYVEGKREFWKRKILKRKHLKRTNLKHVKSERGRSENMIITYLKHDKSKMDNSENGQF